MSDICRVALMRRFPGGRLGAVCVSFLAASLLWAAPSYGAFGLVPGSFDGEVLNEDGTAADQAGQHPHEASTTFLLNTTTDSEGNPIPDEQMRHVEVDLPAGFVGDPTAVPKCGMASLGGDIFGCPPSSQVGYITLLGVDGLPLFPLVPQRIPIYNMVAPPGLPGQFAFNTDIGGVVTLNPSIRSDGDYGITINIRNIPQTIPVAGSEVVLWGVPADDSHDDIRGRCGDGTGSTPPPCPSQAGRVPFLTNPTDCSTGPVRTDIRVESWNGSRDTAFFNTHAPGDPNTLVGPTGCELLEFQPSISVTPTNPQATAPSGYEIELEVPQPENPDGLAAAHLEKAVVTLPQGVTVSPSSADGLGACSPAEIGLANRESPRCPSSSKIGTVEVVTPLLDEPMTGSVFVARQNENPFGSLMAMYLVAEGPGVIVKLAGRIDRDSETGQVTTTVVGNPALPFSSFKISFKGGARAPLANPETCGTKTATASLTPYSAYPEPPAPRVADPAKVVHVSDTFTIDCPGVSGFAPLFEAGTTLPVGGRFSPFTMRIERRDRDQYLRGLTLELPPGLLAKLRGVPLCPDERAAAGTCGMESRVGTATIGAGPGPQPFFLRGSVSLTGPYKGAPYGLAVAVRALAGPYDLGTVVVRQAVHIDRTDAHLTIVSDPLPTIVEGIPLRLRSINVDIDRPGFVLNPTSCGEKRVRATLSSTEGSVHVVAQRFQVGDCRALPLRPRLGLRLTGRRQVGDGRHPGLRAVLSQGSGQANLRKVAVRLPLSLALDPDNARSLCEFADGLRVACPRSSIIGSAVAHTPVLNRPLRGPVYFVKGVRIDRRTGRQIRTLPTLLIPLRGEVAIDLRARSSVRGGRLVNTFEAVPDAPVSRFELNLLGGRNGILVVTNRRNLCRGRHVATVEVDGHNGKRADSSVRMRTPCAKRSARSRERR